MVNKVFSINASISFKVFQYFLFLFTEMTTEETNDIMSETQGFKGFPTKDQEMTTANPWQVESIQAFLFLKCPECPFDSKTKDTFQNHAIENHPLSFVLFGKTLKDIKEEKFDSNLITDDFGNEGDVLIKQEKFESNTLNESDLSVSEQFPGQSFEPIERDGKKVYVCSICDYATNKPSTLKVHISHKHENVRAFNCTECEKSFKAKHHLKRHFAAVHQDKDWLIKEEFNKSNYGKTEEWDPDYDPDYDPDHGNSLKGTVI